MAFVVSPSRNKILQAAWAGHIAAQKADAKKKPEPTEVHKPGPKTRKAPPKVNKPAGKAHKKPPAKKGRARAVKK